MISALANLTSGIINTAVEGAQAAKNLEWQKEAFQRQQDFEKQMAEDAQAFEKSENELAFEREKEMWNMQNFYNSPAEQMKRYADAGLNPNLIYGQGTSGNATSSPSYNPTSATKPQSLTPPQLPLFKPSLPTNISGIEQSIMDYQRLGKDIEQKDEQINFTSANTALTDEKVVAQRIANDFDMRTQDLRYLSMDLDNKVKLGILNEKEAQTEYLKQKAEIDKKDYRLREQKAYSDIKYQDEKTKEVTQDIKNKEQALEKLKAETEKFQQENKLFADTYENKVKTSEFQLKMLISEYGAARVINRAKQLTGRTLGNNPIDMIKGLLIGGEIAIQDLIH